MPKIGEILERVERVKPCAFDDQSRAAWLLELDSKLREEFYPRYEQGTPEAPPELIVPPPWDNLYDLYLMAMIDFHNRDFSNYHNSLELFNAAMQEYRTHHHRTHTPRSGHVENLW